MCTFKFTKLAQFGQKFENEKLFLLYVQLKSRHAYFHSTPKSLRGLRDMKMILIQNPTSRGELFKNPHNYVLYFICSHLKFINKSIVNPPSVFGLRKKNLLKKAFQKIYGFLSRVTNTIENTI